MPPIQYRPLGDWPGEPVRERESAARFTTSLGVTLAELTRELDLIDARSPVLLVDVELEHIRRGGGSLLRAPRTPGVVLEFEQPTRDAKGATTTALARYPCDTYWTWEANLRAIMLTLRALRAVERYGAAGNGQQYRGFLALGSGNGAPGSGAGGVNTGALQLSPERAARILVDAHPDMQGAGQWFRDNIAKALPTMPAAELLAFVRLVRNAVHPDAGGSAGLFATVNAAADVLVNPSKLEPTR